MNEKKLTVGQIARKYGVSARTIRHYESIGILECMREDGSNYRLYGEAESNRVYQIILLKDMGFTLKEISSIITSNGNKNIIIRIINNRLKSLAKKSLLYNQCIALLTEFLDTCSSQREDHIDSFRLLDELLSSKKNNEDQLLLQESTIPKLHPLEKDGDLEILKACHAEDLNPLYLPFVLEQEDGSLLENFFVNHRRFWGLRNVYLSDGSNLDDIYNPNNFINVVTKKLEAAAWDSGIYSNEDEISYRNMVIGFCTGLTGLEFDEGDAMCVLEMKLAASVFKRALEMLELAGRLNEEALRTICRLLKLSDYASKQELEEFIESVVQTGGIQAYYIAKWVNDAVKRNRYAGPFYVLTEPSAFESDYWELDRALDMVVGFMWSHEINPAGQPYKTLAPVIFQIAYMRARELYAAAVHIVPEIVDLEAFMLIGLELVTTDRNGEAFARIPRFEEEEYISKGAADRIPNRVRPGLRFGMNTRRREEYYSFISGEEVSSLDNVPEDMTGEAVPAGKYAVFSVKGGPLPYKVIETIIFIYQAWLPASNYQWVDRPGFNLYENATGRSDSIIKIYVPVEEKGV